MLPWEKKYEKRCTVKRRKLTEDIWLGYLRAEYNFVFYFATRQQRILTYWKKTENKEYVGYQVYCFFLLRRPYQLAYLLWIALYFFIRVFTAYRMTELCARKSQDRITIQFKRNCCAYWKPQVRADNKKVVQQTRKLRFPENKVLLKAKKDLFPISSFQFRPWLFSGKSDERRGGGGRTIGEGGGIIIGPNLHFRWVDFERRGGTDDDRPPAGILFSVFMVDWGWGGKGEEEVEGPPPGFCLPLRCWRLKKWGRQKMQKVVGGNKISRIIALLYAATYNSIQN